MKVLVNGVLGRMGQAVVEKLTADSDAIYVAGVDAIADGKDKLVYNDIFNYDGDVDVIIDFSHHSCTKKMLEYAEKKCIPVVLCTTGHTEEELKIIDDATKNIPIFRSANMSIGIAILCDFAKKAAALMPDADIEIVESHHNQKLDAPSGTALMIANEIKEARTDAEFVMGRNGQKKREPNEIGIHALRLGGIVGEHEVILNTGVESITLKHQAYTRALFADGAVVAAKFLCGKPAGAYNMKSILAKE